MISIVFNYSRLSPLATSKRAVAKQTENAEKLPKHAKAKTKFDIFDMVLHSQDDQETAVDETNSVEANETSDDDDVEGMSVNVTRKRNVIADSDDDDDGDNDDNKDNKNNTSDVNGWSNKKRERSQDSADSDAAAAVATKRKRTAVIEDDDDDE